MKNHIMPKYKLIFDVKKIANSLWIKEEQALKGFSDGRVISRFSEYWTEKLYGFQKCENSNEAIYDGFIENPLLGKITISVRSLTHSGIKFQQSKHQGSGRICNIDLLKIAVSLVDFQIIVDIVDFPIVYLLPKESDFILELIKNKKITCSGLKREKVYQYLFNECDFNNLDFKEIKT